jgi:enoyl-CoA hydratase/carnithine racemase
VELGHEIARLPQGAIRSDKETMIGNVGRSLEEQLRRDAEATVSMFMRRDPHSEGARAFKQRRPAE